MPGAEDVESSIKLTVAVSCYNEADFIGTTLDTVVRSGERKLAARTKSLSSMMPHRTILF